MPPVSTHPSPSFQWLRGQPAPTTLGERFAGVIDGLRHAIAGNRIVTAPLLYVIQVWLGRKRQRLLALIEAIQAGTLQQRVSRAGRPMRRPSAPPQTGHDSAAPDAAGQDDAATGEAASPRPPVRDAILANLMRMSGMTEPPGLPRGFGMLLRLGSRHAEEFAETLRALLADAEMQGLIAAAPGPMGRELRPLCHALGIGEPPIPPAPGNPRTPSDGSAAVGPKAAVDGAPEGAAAPSEATDPVSPVHIPDPPDDAPPQVAPPAAPQPANPYGTGTMPSHAMTPAPAPGAWDPEGRWSTRPRNVTIAGRKPLWTP